MRKCYSAIIFNGLMIIFVLDKLIAPVVEEMGIELYDMEFVKEGGTRVLRLFIDKEGGVDLNDCEGVSRAVEAVLDEHDPIPASYRLQVGSPGVERKLAKPGHFARHLGSKVTVRLFLPLKVSESASRKNFTGVLRGYDGASISLEDSGGGMYSFPVAQVSSCRLRVFDDDKKGRARKNG